MNSINPKALALFLCVAIFFGFLYFSGSDKKDGKFVLSENIKKKGSAADAMDTKEIKHKEVSKPINTNKNISSVSTTYVSKNPPISFISNSKHAQKLETLPSDVLSFPIKVKMESIARIKEGEKVLFPIPQEDIVYSGHVDHVGTILKVHSVQGKIDGDNDMASFSLVSGDKLTFITVNTGTDIYYFEINNESGLGSVYSDKELNKYRNDYDGITPPINKK